MQKLAKNIITLFSSIKVPELEEANKLSSLGKYKAA